MKRMPHGIRNTVRKMERICRYLARARNYAFKQTNSSYFDGHAYDDRFQTLRAEKYNFICGSISREEAKKAIAVSR